MLPLATGVRLGTVTARFCVAEAPCGSFAVTVTVAVPALTAVTVSVPEETDTLATPDADDDAENVRASSSGSVKYGEMSTVAVLSACTVCAGMLPLASGARLGTVTRKPCVANAPPGSVAVTVTVTMPALTAATVTALPETDTVATPGSDDEAL